MSKLEAEKARLATFAKLRAVSKQFALTPPFYGLEQGVNVNTAAGVNGDGLSVNAEVSGVVESRNHDGVHGVAPALGVGPSEDKRAGVATSPLTSVFLGVPFIGPGPALESRALLQEENLRRSVEAFQSGLISDRRTSSDKHKPGYMAAYMRAYRAKKKA